MYILIAILLLGVIVTIHELGHFLAARICGIPVKAFSIGFGPAIVKWKSKKHETEFKISPIPLGGYCMFYGEPGSDLSSEANQDPRAYNNYSVYKRMFTVIAGPFMNFVLAIVLAIIMTAFYGSKVEGLKVASLTQNSAAYEAGIMMDDQIIAVEDEKIENENINSISELVQKYAQVNKTISISLIRENKKLDLNVMPQYDEASKRFLLGIQISPILSKLPASQIIPEAFKYCINATRLIGDALAKLFTKGEGFDQAAGPIGVISLVGEQTKKGGLPILINLAIIISINLGMVNLLPIPSLDGSRFLIMLVEAIRRKPINQKIEGIIHMTGFVALMALIIYLSVRDIGNIIR